MGPTGFISHNCVNHHKTFLHTRKTFLNHNISRLIFVFQEVYDIWDMGWVPPASFHTNCVNHHKAFLPGL